jgi:transcriptional regulator with XRE-family HTH domain
MSIDHQLTGRQIAAGRALAGLSQAELASAANISVPTLGRMEASAGPASGYANNLEAVRRAIEAAGVEFTNGDEPGVKLGKPKPPPIAEKDTEALAAFKLLSRSRGKANHVDKG